MKRALITGAASGIGLATALHFLQDGWQVTGLDCRDSPPGLAAAGWVKCDLADASSVTSACDMLAAELSFDALIISAGMAGVGDPAKVLQVNFFAARQIVSWLSPHVQECGSITLVSSGAGWRWMERRHALLRILEEPDEVRALEMALDQCGSAAEAYNVSKELLSAFVAHDCLVNWARDVRLNSVSPGNVDTPLIADFTNSMGERAMGFARQTVGRDGRPQEIAEVIAFLSSGRASWINGADIKVDGGLTGALAGAAARFDEWDS